MLPSPGGLTVPYREGILCSTEQAPAGGAVLPSQVCRPPDRANEGTFMQAIHGRLLHGLTTIALTIGTGFLSVYPLHKASCVEKPNVPNVVIVFTDDQGYADVGCFGAKGFTTPNLDRMAAEGIRFTDFYVAQAVCSASRAALLTGCYSNRVGILGALGPSSKHGIHANEITLAQLLKSRGYATAIYGKWHLGDDWQFLPTRHGFD